MLSRLKIRDFRCFKGLDLEFSRGTTVLAGVNAQGKTSLLEAICVLLRLQSPRVSQLGAAIRHERKGFVVDGIFQARHLQFYYSRERRKLALDSVEQSTPGEYLGIGRVVWFSNQDIEIVRGASEQRRRFLDFVGMQIDAGYRGVLRSYTTALRSRNRLLKQSRTSRAQVLAFNAPMIESGTQLAEKRARLVSALSEHAAPAHGEISGRAEILSVEFSRGDRGDFAKSLASAEAEDFRLGQTTTGPHRDDFQLILNGFESGIASEGQQRSIALALKLAQARLIVEKWEAEPILLIDDIFGELDLERRNALLRALPTGAQRFVTTTDLGWMAKGTDASVFRVAAGQVLPEHAAETG